MDKAISPMSRILLSLIFVFAMVVLFNVAVYGIDDVSFESSRVSFSEYQEKYASEVASDLTDSELLEIIYAGMEKLSYEDQRILLVFNDGELIEMARGTREGKSLYASASLSQENAINELWNGVDLDIPLQSNNGCGCNGGGSCPTPPPIPPAGDEGDDDDDGSTVPPAPTPITPTPPVISAPKPCGYPGIVPPVTDCTPGSGGGVLCVEQGINGCLFTCSPAGTWDAGVECMNGCANGGECHQGIVQQ